MNHFPSSALRASSPQGEGFPLLYETEDSGDSIPVNQLSCETMDIIKDESYKKVLSNPIKLLVIYRDYLNSMKFFD